MQDADYVTERFVGCHLGACKLLDTTEATAATLRYYEKLKHKLVYKHKFV